MRRSDPTNKFLPRWAWFLPGLGWTATLVLLYVLNGRTGQIHLFNLSPKDSFLVAWIGDVLVWTVIGLLIYCIALMRALRRAVQQSTRS